MATVTAEKDDLGELLTRILRQATELLNADGASIFLIEDESLLVLRATTSPLLQPQVNLKQINYKIGEGFTGRVFDSGESILVPDFRDTAKMSTNWRMGKYDECELPENHLTSFIAVPISSGDRRIGVIRCVRKLNRDKSAEHKGFTQEHVRLLEVFAQTAAAAIETLQKLAFATTAPYAFVLMPFTNQFQNIYEYGIRDIAKTLRIRCERVDEIEFNDTILSQIYKGIESADIVIADMTGRNPNVFYEVGYAHALHKDVVLLTQNVKDIPFDLKGHNHIVYGGQISVLKEKLRKRLDTWLTNRKQAFPKEEKIE